MADNQWFDDGHVRLVVDSSGLGVVYANYVTGGFIAGVTSGDFLPWDAHPQGDELFDMTDPTHPTALAAGMYAMTVSAGPDAGMQAGKSQQLELHAAPTDQQRPGARVYDTRPLDSALNVGPIGWVAITWHLEAGDPVFVKLYHDIGATADYDYNMFVQRVS